MTTVRVIRMGPLVAACDVAWLVRAANSSQKVYRFEVGDPLQSLGDPDEDGAYPIDNLIDILVKSRAGASGAILVGIVDVTMGDEYFSAVNRENDCILVSISGVQPILEKTRTTLQGYVLVEVAAQLLTIAYRQRADISTDPDECELPWHGDTRQCLFDYCEKREHSGKKLMAPNLCVRCRAKLDEVNVPQRVLVGATGLFNTGVKRSLLGVLDDITHNRLVMFLLGAIVASSVRPALAAAGVSAQWLLGSGVMLFAGFVLTLWLSSSYKRRIKLQA